MPSILHLSRAEELFAAFGRFERIHGPFNVLPVGQDLPSSNLETLKVQPEQNWKHEILLGRPAGGREPGHSGYKSRKFSVNVKRCERGPSEIAVSESMLLNVSYFVRNLKKNPFNII